MEVELPQCKSPVLFLGKAKEADLNKSLNPQQNSHNHVNEYCKNIILSYK